MAVFENVRLNNEIFPDYSFGRKPTAVDQWADILDNSIRKGPNHGPFNQSRLSRDESGNRYQPRKIRGLLDRKIECALVQPRIARFLATNAGAEERSEHVLLKPADEWIAI